MNETGIKQAYEVLERFQLAYLEENGIPLEDYYLHEEDMRNFPEKDRLLYENPVLHGCENLVLPTRYEIGYMYQLLKKHVDKVDDPAIKREITETFGVRSQAALLFPVWGTVPSFDFSAEIHPIGSDIKLIMISDAVFTCAHLLSKIIDSLMFSRDKSGGLNFDLTYERMKRRIEKNPAIQQRYNDFMGSMLFFQTPVFAKQYFCEPSIFQYVMLNGFETFVVAHEYAHSLCGHMNKRYISSNGIGKTASDAGAEMICHDWEDECEADVVGAHITLATIAHAGEYPDFSKWVRFMGIYLCANMFELQEKVNKLKLGRCSVSETHPPGAVRKGLLLKMFFPEGVPEVYSDLDRILDEMWKSFAATVREIIRTTVKEAGADAKISFSSFQNIIYQIS